MLYRYTTFERLRNLQTNLNMEIGFLTLILITVLTVLYLYIKKHYSYWKDRNVVELEPTLFYGNFKQMIKGEASLMDVVSEIYNKVKTKGEKFGGFYSFFSPIFVPVNLDIIKGIMQTDFAHFVNHGMYVHEEKEPLTAHLFALEDEKWRNLRAKLTPTFTTGKMKMIFQTLTSCSIGLEKLLKVASTSKNGIDIKDIVARYAIDITGSIGFGLDINTMENPHSEFRRFGLELFDPNTTGNRIFMILSFLPKWFAKLLNLRTLRKEVATFFINLVNDTVAYREKNNIYRKDFLHLLIQLKNFGKVDDNDDSRVVNQSKNTVQGLTMNEVAAQCYVFFIAGFETSSLTMTYAILELAQRQDIQDKVREEIIKVLEKYNNEMTYEAIAEMQYLEKTVLETLRKHPPVPVLPRICTKKYHVPNSDIILDIGAKVNVPVFAIQRDPDNYPDPDKFEPERFNEENKAKRHPMVFLPFGEGPRLCIGYRLGKLQTKVGLCSILKNYKVTLHEKTQLPIKYESTLSTAVKGGVWINLEPIN